MANIVVVVVVVVAFCELNCGAFCILPPLLLHQSGVQGWIWIAFHKKETGPGPCEHAVPVLSPPIEPMASNLLLLLVVVVVSSTTLPPAASLRLH